MLPARLQVRRVLGELLALFQPYVRLFPVGTVPRELATATFLAREVRGTNALDLHLEDRLHGLLDLRLGRLRGDFEDQRLFGFLNAQSFFSNDRTAKNLISGFHYATSALRFGADPLSEACNRPGAACVKIARSERRR